MSISKTEQCFEEIGTVETGVTNRWTTNHWTGLDWNGILKFVFTLIGMQL